MFPLSTFPKDFSYDRPTKNLISVLFMFLFLLWFLSPSHLEKPILHYPLEKSSAIDKVPVFPLFTKQTLKKSQRKADRKNQK